MLNDGTNLLNSAQQETVLGRRRKQRDGRWGPVADEVIRSPAVERWIGAFHSAETGGDDYGRIEALQGVVNANRADHAAGGLSVYAHQPLPSDFVESLVAPIRRLPADYRGAALNSLIGDFDLSVRPMVSQQLNAQMNSQPSFMPMRYRAPQQEPQPPAPVPGNGSRAQHSSGNGADASEDESWLDTFAHPPAYALDAALSDLIGEHGLLGDWGWRPGVPPPKGVVARAIGEALRLYIEGGPLGLGKVAGAARGSARAVEGVVTAERGAAAAAAKGAAAERGGASATKTAVQQGEAEAAAGSKTSRRAARPETCTMSCHCYPYKKGANCPPFVYGYGQGPNKNIAYNIAKRVAGSTVPQGCNYRHCRCKEDG